MKPAVAFQLTLFDMKTIVSKQIETETTNLFSGVGGV